MNSINVANLFNLTNVEFHLLLIEGGIFLSFLALLFFMRRNFRRPPMPEGVPGESEDWDRWTREAESLCASFSRNLEEKREIANRLIEQMDERIQQFQDLLDRAGAVNESVPKPSNGNGLNGLNAQILKLAEAGVSVADIARLVHRSQGEIQLVLNLKRHGL